MTKSKSQGFSLLELMVSIAVLVTICGALFSALFAYQKTYASEMLKADMRLGVQGAAETLAQEIGQAGAVPPTTTTLTFFFSSRRRHTRSKRDWSSDVCSSD